KLCNSRRLPGGGLEMHISQAATPAARDTECLAVIGQIGQDLVGNVIPDDRAWRNLDEQCWSGLAGLLAPQTLHAVPGDKFLVVLKLDQTGDVRRDFENDVAATTAVTAVRSAFGRKLLAAERH